MANKIVAVFWVGVLFFCLPPSIQSQDIQIEDIYLIKNRLDLPSAAPSQIRIGLEISPNVFFKLLRQEDVIRAGLFPRGFNSISLPAAPLLQESGKHTFTLELKTETDLVRTEIALDVLLFWDETETEKKEGEETEIQQVKSNEHRVSLFINGELIASRKKILEQKLIMPKKESNLPRNYDPFDPHPMDNPFVNSVDIVQAAGLAYKLIKDLVKKKDRDESVPPIQIARQIALNFRAKNPLGIETQVRATIRLSTKIL